VATKYTTTHYEPRDFTQEEQIGIDDLLEKAGVYRNNTIIVTEPTRYKVSAFSIEIDTTVRTIGEYRGKPVVATKWQFSPVLEKVNHWLKLAKDGALTPIEAEALEHLIKHNETGDIKEHIRYSELWVQDSDPIVEAYLGVIESYRDPSGVRCEYEGFVAAIDPEESRFLHAFVEAAPTILPLLPHSKEYERRILRRHRIMPSTDSLFARAECWLQFIFRMIMKFVSKKGSRMYLCRMLSHPCPSQRIRFHFSSRVNCQNTLNLIVVALLSHWLLTNFMGMVQAHSFGKLTLIEVYLIS
jgi:hypothetical protein